MQALYTAIMCSLLMQHTRKDTEKLAQILTSINIKYPKMLSYERHAAHEVLQDMCLAAGVPQPDQTEPLLREALALWLSEFSSV